MYMNYYTKNNLLTSIDGVTNFLELKHNEEASLVISEYGGRPLGIFPKKDCYSLLWICSDIKKYIIIAEEI